jgi:hypothetical protein
MSAWVSREDYVARLVAEGRLPEGRAERAVRDALASGYVRRRGWYSDAYRLGAMEDGRPDPGPGPSEPHLPLRPTWLERNSYSRIEYSAGDLGYETRQRFVERAPLDGSPRHVGGRPPVVSDAVVEWFNGLPLKQRQLGAGKLAKSYLAESPKRPGSRDYVRKIITKLKLGENPVKT